MITETSQYMTFKLGDELFAINVAQVREVLEVPQITNVPTAPDYMRGVVNVRGQAIPAVDLRAAVRPARGADTVNTRDHRDGARARRRGGGVGRDGRQRA